MEVRISGQDGYAVSRAILSGYFFSSLFRGYTKEFFDGCEKRYRAVLGYEKPDV